MFRIVAALLMIVPASLSAQAPASRLPPIPAAQQLFEHDWVLMNWALKFYDSDHDVLLQPAEAAAAADAFRKLADTNGDGRVTREEYRAARDTILQHY